jgi:hypothetical protein
VLNKVAMLFETRWWGPNDTFGHVADVHHDEQPGWCYLWYTFPQGIAGARFTSMHWPSTCASSVWCPHSKLKVQTRDPDPLRVPACEGAGTASACIND